MIPTRLGQKYKGGSLVGFDKSKSKLLVASNTVKYISSYLYHDVDNVRTLSLLDYPEGYQWPSVNDFNVIDPTYSFYCAQMFNRFLCTNQAILRNHEHVWFVTNQLYTSDDKMFTSYMIVGLCVTQHIIEVHSDSFYENNDGYLCPVLFVS